MHGLIFIYFTFLSSKISLIISLISSINSSRLTYLTEVSVLITARTIEIMAVFRALSSRYIEKKMVTPGGAHDVLRS